MDDIRKAPVIIDSMACCPENARRTLYEALDEALVTQEAAQEHLSGAFAVIGLEPYKREQGRNGYDTIDTMICVLLQEMKTLNAMTMALAEMVGTPKNR